MLSLLKNNFVISGIVSLILVGFIASQEKNKNEKHGLLFYIRYFALCYILMLVVLYLKTGDLSLPTSANVQSGGSLNFQPVSTTPSVTSSNSINLGTTDVSDLGLSRVDLGSTPF